MKKIIVLMTALSLANIAQAQSDFVKPGSIGQPASTSTSCEFTEFSTPLVTCWVGQKVLFLPTSKDFQHYGYFFKRAGSEDGIIPYAELVGKVGTVTKVEKVYVAYAITIQIDGTNATYIGDAYGNDAEGYSLNGIALIRELQDARNALKGKTVWLNASQLSQYDDNKGIVSYVPVKSFRPLYVEDVVAGSFFSDPVRLIVKTENNVEGYVDILYSGINSGGIRKVFPFEKEVYLNDPRTTHNWSSEVWTAIENKKVIPGMTMEQVRFFLLQNHDTNQTTTKDGTIEQWTFKKYGIVTFVNGIVSSFSILN